MSSVSSTKKRHRYKALDGLRGLAAFSVFLSHLQLSVFGIHLSGWKATVWQVLAEGPNSVQILFVLSGFLMASLYSKIESFPTFIGKRYARIFPLLTSIVCFLWLRQVFELRNTVLEVGILVCLALSVRCVWHLVASSNQAIKIGKILLVGFLGLQGIMIGFHLFISPLLIKIYDLPLPSMMSNLILLFSNVTLTTSITQSVPLLSSVLWSLAPEVLFYLLFPVLVLPLIRLSSHFGKIVGLCLILGCMKLLFDLQPVFYSLLSLDSLSIGRGSGFLIGVVVGTWYQQKNKIWQVLLKFLQKPLIGVLILMSFLAIHSWNGVTSLGHQQEVLPWYYLLSSCSIGLLLILITQEKKITHFLTFRPFIFLGKSSFSLYLIHRVVIEWIERNLSVFEPFPEFFKPYLLLMITIFSVISVSYFLYIVVEKLYFEKIHIPLPNLNSTKKNSSLKKWLPLKYYSGTFILGSLLLITYSAGYSPSLLVTRHSLPTQGKTSLLNKVSFIPFEATYDNLSIVALKFTYQKNKNTTISCQLPSQLVFKIKDQETNRVIFESNRDAAQVEGDLLFPFGFPPLSNSADQSYSVELTQTRSLDEEIFIDPDQTKIITQYLLPKTSLPAKVTILFWNRLTYALTQWPVIFGLVFINWVLFLFKKRSF